MEAPADRGEHRRGREAGGATGARAILAQPRSEGNAMSEIQIAARHVLLGADHHGGDAAMSPKELRRVVRWVERRKAHAARRELIRRAMRGYKPRDPNGPAGGGVSESHAQFCQREVDWYLKHGKYPNTRITSTSDGLRFVIGDWAWHRAHPRHEEHIEDRMKRAGITAFPPERKDAPEHGSSEPRDS